MKNERIKKAKIQVKKSKQKHQERIEKLKAGQLNKLNIEVSKNYLNTKKLRGIF